MRSVLLSCGRFDTCRRSTLSCWRRTSISATSFVLGLKREAMIWRISRRNSIIKWQGYRVSAWRLAESNFRYTQVIQSAEEPAGEHRMLIVEGSKIVGAVFVGPPGAGKFIGTIIQLNMDIERVMADLRRGNWEALGRLVTGEAGANTQESLAQSFEPRRAVGPVVSDRSPTESLGPRSPRTAPA